MKNLLNILYYFYYTIYCNIAVKTCISTALIIIIIFLKYYYRYDLSLKKLMKKLFIIHVSHSIHYYFIYNIENNIWNIMTLIEFILVNISIRNTIIILKYYYIQTNQNLFKSLLYYFILINNDINNVDFNRLISMSANFNIDQIYNIYKKNINAPAA